MGRAREGRVASKLRRPCLDNYAASAEAVCEGDRRVSTALALIHRDRRSWLLYSRTNVYIFLLSDFRATFRRRSDARTWGASSVTQTGIAQDAGGAPSAAAGCDRSALSGEYVLRR